MHIIKFQIRRDDNQKVIILESLEDIEVFLEWFYFQYELSTKPWFVLIFNFGNQGKFIFYGHFRSISAIHMTETLKTWRAHSTRQETPHFQTCINVTLSSLHEIKNPILELQNGNSQKCLELCLPTQKKRKTTTTTTM